MESEIIDFAQWYSGMERSKVESAYQRYLKERRKALSQAAVSGSVCVCEAKGFAGIQPNGRCGWCNKPREAN